MVTASCLHHLLSKLSLLLMHEACSIQVQDEEQVATASDCPARLVLMRLWQPCTIQERNPRPLQPEQNGPLRPDSSSRLQQSGQRECNKPATRIMQIASNMPGSKSSQPKLKCPHQNHHVRLARQEQGSGPSQNADWMVLRCKKVPKKAHN